MVEMNAKGEFFQKVQLIFYITFLKKPLLMKIDAREPTLWTGKFSTTRQQQQPSKQILLAQYVVQLSSHLVGSFQHSDVHRIISIKTVNFKTDINVGGWQNCQCPWHASYGTRPAAEADRQFAKRAVGTIGTGENNSPHRLLKWVLHGHHKGIKMQQ